MNSFANDALYLTLDEFTEVDLIRIANNKQRRVDIGVQLRANILALEGHGYAALESNSSIDRPVALESLRRLSTLG